VGTGATVGGLRFENRTQPASRTGDAGTARDARFCVAVTAAVAVGAVVRFRYLAHGAPVLVHSDGGTYWGEAVRIADGLGYTSPIGNVGEEWAHHAPGWVTLLSWVTEAGWRSMRDHQVVGLLVGLVLIVVAALVGRRYAGRRVGMLAALLAAVYPGFWVLEAQILSEPLGLVVAGVLMLVLADLWERPTLARAVLAGAVTGLLALVRSEQVALLVIAVAPILLLNRDVAARRRLAWTGAAAATALVVIAPWTIYNQGRFEQPVVLSTNVGFTLLAGNCPPTTYAGELIGSYDMRCDIGLLLRNPEIDRSEHDVQARREALSNLRQNAGHLPEVVAARYGRLLGVFRPSQTVAIAASWAGSATWPVWAWVASFWLVLPLAVWGSVILRRSRTFQWPLLAPLVIVAVVVAVSYGEPRYHTPADLGLLVLAAVAIDRLLGRIWLRAAGTSSELAETRAVANLGSSDGARVSQHGRDELNSWGKLRHDDGC
jgi:4-amino-4-deoxy-L-arabinose transferase-like glycosyltransferase